MAWARGTATDFIDFLRKLRDYAAGTIDPAVHGTINQGVQVPVGQRWTILSNGGLQPGLPGADMATDGEVYMQGPGSDPDDEIVVGVKTYRNTGANIFGWEMRGFTAFDNTLAFTTMPGVSPPVYAAFDDATFNVWFWVNARRMMALARIGTSDILIHMGFIQQFGTRSQYPYPLMIGGSVAATDISFQTNNFDHGCLPDPCNNGVRLRWVDGTWDLFRNYNQGSQVRSQARTDAPNVLWPQRDPTVATSPSGDSSPTGAENDLFESFSVNNSLLLTAAEVGSYPLFPALLMKTTANVGRIDGLYVVAGAGLVAGDVIQVGADNYDVFKNTWRSEPVDFFAIKRE